MEKDAFLGRYISFPKYSHYTAHYSTLHDIKHVKKAIIGALKSIDGKKDSIRLSIAGIEGEVDGERTFSVKIADGNKFKRLNNNIINVITGLIINNLLNFIDFEIRIKYRYMRDNGRKRSSWSDRYLVRIYFTEGAFKVQISHVGGLRRFSPEDLGKLIYLRLIQIMRKMGVRPLIRKIYELS